MRVRCGCILMLGLVAFLSQTEAFVMAPCSLSILSRSSPRSAAPSCSMPSRSTPRFALRMGFLGWDFGKDLGGKGIREILGIISCEASHILIKGPGSAERCKELKEMVLDGISIPMGDHSTHIVLFVLDCARDCNLFHLALSRACTCVRGRAGIGIQDSFAEVAREYSQVTL